MSVWATVGVLGPFCILILSSSVLHLEKSFLFNFKTLSKQAIVFFYFLSAYKSKLHAVHTFAQAGSRDFHTLKSHELRHVFTMFTLYSIICLSVLDGLQHICIQRLSLHLNTSVLLIICVYSVLFSRNTRYEQSYMLDGLLRSSLFIYSLNNVFHQEFGPLPIVIPLD